MAVERRIRYPTLPRQRKVERATAPQQRRCRQHRQTLFHIAGYEYADGYKPLHPVDTLHLPDSTPIINPLINQPLIMHAGVSVRNNVATGDAIGGNYAQTVNSVDELNGESYLQSARCRNYQGYQMYDQFVRGKPMDYQRSDGRFDKLFKPFSSYNYGAVARAAGYSLDETLMAAGVYNWMGTTGRKDGIYGNDPENVPLIELGWKQQPLFSGRGGD
jgi:hypothetical protein